MRPKPYIAVIDPAGHTPELDCFNQMVLDAPCGLHYHLPALYGLDSLRASPPGMAGMIILGSSTSVPDEPAWQAALFDWIWEQAERRIPLLGICYGHQLIAHKLGGRVEFIEPDKKTKESGFRTLDLDPVSFSPSPTTGPMVVSHREIVTQVPQHCQVFARSDQFTCEGLVHRQLPVWTLQPHPEATFEFLKNQRIALPAEADQLAFGREFVKKFMQFCASSPRSL